VATQQNITLSFYLLCCFHERIKPPIKTHLGSWTWAICQTFHFSVRIWLHLKSHHQWSPPVVVGGPCVQRSEWPSTPRVILWE